MTAVEFVFLFSRLGGKSQKKKRKVGFMCVAEDASEPHTDDLLTGYIREDARTAVHAETGGLHAFKEQNKTPD